jgi:hypothetical protein
MTPCAGNSAGPAPRNPTTNRLRPPIRRSPRHRRRCRPDHRSTSRLPIRPRPKTRLHRIPPRTRHASWTAQPAFPHLHPATDRRLHLVTRVSSAAFSGSRIRLSNRALPSPHSSRARRRPPTRNSGDNSSSRRLVGSCSARPIHPRHRIPGRPRTPGRHPPGRLNNSVPTRVWHRRNRPCPTPTESGGTSSSPPSRCRRHVAGV